MTRFVYGPVAVSIALLAALAMPQDGASLANVHLKSCKEKQTRKECEQEEARAACRGKAGKDCEDELKPGYKKHHEEQSKQHKRKHFKAGDKDRDSDKLVDGPYTPYEAPSAAADTVPPDSFLAFREKDQALAAASTGDPQGFIAHPDFAGDGGKVKDCGEYVYKKYWDWSRYEDAIFACKSDRDCELDVALGKAGAGGSSGPPHIARRSLEDSAGKKLPAPSSVWNPPPEGGKQFALLRGRYPKNVFFALGLPPVAGGVDPVAEVLPALKPELAELRALLETGAQYYRIEGAKAAGDDEAFPDEWAWHDAMRTLTAAVPEAVSDEMEHRTKKLESLMARIAVRGSGSDKDKDGHDVPQDPLKVLGPDPFERLDAFSDLDLFAARHGAGQRAYGADVPERARGEAGKKGSRLLAGVALRKGWQADPQNPRRFLCTAEATPATVTAMTDKGKVTRQTSAVEECQAWNLLLDEWDRLTRNRAKPGGCTNQSNCGCLHIAANDHPEQRSYGCDWSPDKFAHRWVTPQHYVHERSKDWNHCQRFKGYTRLGDDDRKSLASFEAALERGEEKYKEWQKLPNISDDRPLAFGQNYHSGAHAGDNDTFAASYAYDAGWELDPIAVVTKAGPDQGKVCQMSGRAWGGFDADAHLLGHKLTLVDAAAWIVSNQWSPKHPLGSRKAEFSAHVTLLGIQLFKIPEGGKRYSFKDPDKDSGASFVKDIMDFNQAVPSPKGGDGDPDQIKIPDPPFSATVFLGPVPVTISGGAGIHYGAKLHPRTHAPEGCEKEIKEFGVDLVFKPYIDVSGFVEGGVGIPGCEVGIRAEVTLIDLALPVTATLAVEEKKGKPAGIEFDIGVSGVLRSLGGKVSLDFQFLFWDEQVTLFKWKGLGPHKFEVVPPVGGHFPIHELAQFVVDGCKKGKARDPICAGQAGKP